MPPLASIPTPSSPSETNTILKPFPADALTDIPAAGRSRRAPPPDELSDFDLSLPEHLPRFLVDYALQRDDLRI